MSLLLTFSLLFGITVPIRPPQPPLDLMKVERPHAMKVVRSADTGERFLCANRKFYWWENNKFGLFYAPCMKEGDNLIYRIRVEGSDER